MLLLTLITVSLATFSIVVNGEDVSPSICYGECSNDDSTGKEICKFTAKVNVHASELGYFQFQECGDVDNPTLGIELGKTYQFIQEDRTNHMHPIGFAYYPDGAHDDVEELEPGIVPPGSSSDCSSEFTCPAPMYHVDDIYLGSYSNIAANTSLEELRSNDGYNAEDFGLDSYEPKFMHPMNEWLGYGTFNVYLKFDITDFQRDLFYFCHIHQYMTGRIKLLYYGVPIQDADLPPLGYEYDSPGAHDFDCGTYGLDDYQLPHAECPQKFVCDTSSENEPLQKFAQCIDSMNCAMMVGMTNSVKDTSDGIALFIYQMIPHHQNAVNMAKALLKTGTILCDDLTDKDSDQAVDCAMEVILRDIINNQNAQIQDMRSILETKNFPQENDCKVVVSNAEELNSSGGIIVHTRIPTFTAFAAFIFVYWF